MLPNVLLIVLDTARADAFTPYGGPRRTAPAIADLAHRGAAINNVYSTANWTLPSHASMFTGLLPRSIGLESSAQPRDAMDRLRDRVLTEILRRNGYATAAVSANVFISPLHGFDVGFDRFEVVTGTRRAAADTSLKSRARWALEALQARLDDGLAATDAILRSWLSSKDNKPFFWFVNLMECHTPYLPPKPWNDLSPQHRILAGEDAWRYQSHDGLIRVTLGDIPLPATSVRRMKYLYERSIASMDAWLGRLLETLDREKLLDDTLVIVTSDHGENLGEDHTLGHAIGVWERLIRVPLIGAGPGWPPGSTGGEQSSLVELPRMIAEATGVSEHPWEESPVPRGIAVAQCDGFSALAPHAAEKLIEAWRLWPRAREELFLQRSCIVDGVLKLVSERGTVRLHDVASDPLERSDVGAARPEDRDRLAGVLAGVDAASEAWLAPAASPATHAPAPEGKEAAELEERLRLLGYI